MPVAQRRYYSSTAAATSLSAAATASATTLTTAALSGYPQTYPWTAVIDANTASEELVSVTAVSGAGPFTLTISRGVGGTSAQAHNAGATFSHVAYAQDFDDAGAHIAATSGVHGIAGNVVGDTDAQTLTNKTLGNPTIGSFEYANHDHSSTANAGAIPESSVTNLVTDLANKVDLPSAQTISGAKTFSALITATAGLNLNGRDMTTVPGYPQATPYAGTSIGPFTACQNAVAALPYDTLQLVFGFLLLGFPAASSSQWDCQLFNTIDGKYVGAGNLSAAGSSELLFTPCATRFVAKNTAITWRTTFTRTTGTDSATCYNDGTANNIFVVTLPVG